MPFSGSVNQHASTGTMTTHTSHRNTGVNKSQNCPVLEEV